MKLDIKKLPLKSTGLQKILSRHAIISFILAMSVLIYCIYSIQQIFTVPSDQAYREQQMQKNTKTSFDQKTVKQVEQLRTTKDTSPIVLPDGRINPFKE